MSDLFVEVSRSSTPKAIEEQIKHLIVSRQLVTGDALPPERQFAARLGVSRSTLREALRALTEEGIIAARQGSGWAVQPNAGTAASNLAVYFRLEDVTFEQVTEAREATEPTIARLAAERRTDEQLAQITAALTPMSSVSGAEFVKADSEFHALIATAADNVLLSFSMLPTMSLLEELRIAVSSTSARITASQAEHERIVAAIRDHDGERAEREMRAHIVGFRDRGREVAREAGR
jgi:GntR family transcriptional repressor for pyruvate dehydrogenase complex